MCYVFQDFDTKFERGECPGWAREQAGAMAHTGAHLDLSAFSTPEVRWEDSYV